MRPPAARMTSPVIQADSSDAGSTACGAISANATEAAEGRLLQQNGAGVIHKGPCGCIAFGLCMTGGDGVNADLARCQFERQSPGQCFNGILRGNVQQGSHHRMRAEDRAEVDDAPAVGPESLDRLMDGENRSENVDVVVEVKVLFGDLREGAETEHSGVVDQDVQSSERRLFKSDGERVGFQAGVERRERCV